MQDHNMENHNQIGVWYKFGTRYVVMIKENNFKNRCLLKPNHLTVYQISVQGKNLNSVCVRVFPQWQRPDHKVMKAPQHVHRDVA